MYCPNCSQQQVSDEVRFCSRCGFSLSAVRELIASGSGFVERGAEAQPGQLSRSQKGVRKGARLMLMSLAMTLAVAFLTAMNDDFAILGLVPFLCFIIGFGRVLYGVFLADRAPLLKRATSQTHGVPMMPEQIAGAARNPELSPARTAPIRSFNSQQTKTAEMVQPPSVAEGTTRLLDEEGDSQRGYVS